MGQMATVEHNRIPAVIAAVQAATRKWTRVTAQVILEYSQIEVPVDTGELMDSGHLEPIDNGFAVVYDAPHSLFVHDGTSRMAANPFLERAWHMAEGEYLGFVQEAASTIERAAQ
jgi:hypothetical protein